MINKKRIFYTLFIIAILFVSGVIYFGEIFVIHEPQKNLRLKISRPKFHPDGENIVFNYCIKGSQCTLAKYNLVSAKISFYERNVLGSEDSFWADASFSRDGKTIAFVIGTKDTHYSQIAVMSVDGTGFRKITGSQNRKRAPSFSPDGKRILYIAGNSVGVTKRIPVSSFDIYEVNVDTGQENQLTYFNFYETSAPYYVTDSMRFIFSADGPSTRSERSMEEGFRNKFTNKYRENMIFIMDKTNQDLVPILQNGESSSSPTISADGTNIVFHSRTNEMDSKKGPYVYDLFLFSNGKNSRLTHSDARLLEPFISFDGKRVVFIYERKRSSGASPSPQSLGLLNTDGTGFQTIEIPTELR